MCTLCTVKMVHVQLEGRALLAVGTYFHSASGAAYLAPQQQKLQYKAHVRISARDSIT